MQAFGTIKWLIIGLFLLFFAGMFWLVKTGVDNFEPPPAGYDTKQLFHQADVRRRAVGDELGLVLKSNLIDQKSIHVGENDVEVSLTSLKGDVQIKEAAAFVILERPASLAKRQAIEIPLLTTALPAKEVAFKGKLLVPEKGEWDLWIEVIINQDAAKRERLQLEAP